MFRTNVKKDKLELYKRHHKGVWPEVERGLRKAGVKLLSIHCPSDGGNALQMYIELEQGVDMARDLGPGSSYRSVERVKVWEELMCTFFEGGTWTMLDELYTLTGETSTNSLPAMYT
mmetsp:Transcript_24068/g.78308  ORF Transcript_24068/g.78308 Transcript_24068/m.78308 type:complete len:117 (+) Transcript_24068:113-463(+)